MRVQAASRSYARSATRTTRRLPPAIWWRASRERRPLHSRKRPVVPSAGVAAGDEPRSDGRTRSERRDAEARAKLTPLAPGERPAAVTAAALVAVALAVANVGAYLAGAKIGGHRPPPLQIVAFSGVALALAGGMWRNRYWAVLT